MSDFLFLVIMVLFWTLIIYSLPLTLAGMTYRAKRRSRVPGKQPRHWPGVTVLVPAHNEGIVIERSLRRFLALDYPREKLDILVINDASTDDTGEICDRFAAESQGRIRVLHRQKPDGGQGKSAALNAALPLCKKKYIALYDADSRPHPNAVKLMVEELQGSDYVAAVGRLVKMNRQASLFNRFTSFEYTAFQWVTQAGRGRLFDIVLLTGTHFVIRRDAVEEAGGWDPQALTEDFELSLRLYAKGKRAVLVPEAVSEEQDPQHLRVWMRQRERWMMGNFYALIKHWRELTWTRNWRSLLAIVEKTLVFCVFLAALIISDILLFSSLVGAVHFHLQGPYILLWLGALIIFVLTHQLSQAAEGEDGWLTPLIAALMYATYTQLWLIVFFRSITTYTRKKGKVAWVKTPRYQY